MDNSVTEDFLSRKAKQFYLKANRPDPYPFPPLAGNRNALYLSVEAAQLDREGRMEQDEAWLKALVARRTQETWRSLRGPYYISFIAIDAAKENVDYKSIISPLKLRQWALTVEVDGVKAVAHPVHKAKVGFVPADEEYVFDDKDANGAAKASSITRPPAASQTRRSTLQFMEALSTLSDEELDKIIIPVRTIVRLFFN